MNEVEGRGGATGRVPVILQWVSHFSSIYQLKIVQWLLCLKGCFYTVVGDKINIMKTTFELNFDFYQALKSMDTQKYGNKEKLSI